jgi:hypothetical protein
MLLKRPMVALLVMAAAPLAFFALPGSASAAPLAGPVLRKGVFTGIWHTDHVQIIITQVNPNGSFTGELRFDPHGRWGDVRTGFHAQRHGDGSITMTRDDCGNSQIARTGRPIQRGTMMIWKGDVKGPDFTSTFELSLPIRR